MTFTEEQKNAFMQSLNSDCIIETGRTWGKTTLAVQVAIAATFDAKVKDVLLFEPSMKDCDIAMNKIKELFPDSISKRNVRTHEIVFDNNSAIHFFTYNHWNINGLKYNKVIFDEYSMASYRQLRTLFMSFKGVSKCYITTPTENASTYLLRKLMYLCNNFHYFRFPSPEEFITAESKAAIEDGNAFMRAQLLAEIRPDPVYNEVRRLENEIKSLKDELDTATAALRLAVNSYLEIENTLDKIKCYEGSEE